MAKGLYRDENGWVMMDYGKHQAPIPREQYELEGYEPPYERLPTEKEFKAKAAKQGK